MKAMTVTEFESSVQEAMMLHREWRHGQTVFNLACANEDIALSNWTNSIRSTALDPYHDDSKIQQFILAAQRAGHLI